MTGSQTPVIMSWVMMLVVMSLICLTWKTRIMMVIINQLKQGNLGRLRTIYLVFLKVLE